MGAGALDFARRLYGALAQRAADNTADALLEWARSKTREHRKAKGIEGWDGPPDFFDGREVEVCMADELAELLSVPKQRLELVSAVRENPLAMYAVYRDAETGQNYSVAVGRDSATFKRLGDEGEQP
jgi:hypothetical protein